MTGRCMSSKASCLALLAHLGSKFFELLTMLRALPDKMPEDIAAKDLGGCCGENVVADSVQK